jgi:hypothetical protein
MLFFSIFFLVLTLVFWSWGQAVLRFSVGKNEFGFADGVLLGLSFSGLLAGLWYCFLPVNFLFSCLLAGSGLAFFLAFFKDFRAQIGEIKGKTWIIGSLVFLFLGMKALAVNEYYDNGLYYIQTIKWVREYAVVPGLANLHFRLGNISLWHVLMAPFYQSPFGIFDDLGEILFFWFLIGHLDILLKNKGFESFLSFFFIVFGFLFADHFLGTASPDLACGLLGIHGLNKLREFIYFSPLSDKREISPAWVFVLVFSLFLVGIKLSSLPYLLSVIIVFGLMLIKQKRKEASFLTVFGILFTLSLVFRSWTLSGYLLFPGFKGFFLPDWLVPESVVNHYLLLVKGFARHILSYQDLMEGKDYLEIGRLTFFDWLPIWFSDRTFWDWCLIVIVFSGWLTLIWNTHQFVRKSFSLNWPKILFTWVCSFLLLFWFSNAPDIRFALGVFGFLFSYFFAFWSYSLMEKSRLDFLNYTFYFWFLVSIFFLVLFRSKMVLQNQLVFLPKNKQIQFSTYKTKNGQEIHHASNPDKDPFFLNDQCWDAPLPCACKKETRIEFRGSGIQEGFRFEK